MIEIKLTNINPKKVKKHIKIIIDVFTGYYTKKYILKFRDKNKDIILFNKDNIQIIAKYFEKIFNRDKSMN